MIKSKMNCSMDNANTHPSNNLSRDFWQFFRNSINDKKKLTSIQDRIMDAKKIITPIIQDLMNDALLQTEVLNGVSVDEESICNKPRELTVSFNMGCKSFMSQNKDRFDWAENLLEEINKDFESSKQEISEQQSLQLPPEEEFKEETNFDETLILKLIRIHEQLGDIIKRLCDKYQAFSDINRKFHASVKQPEIIQFGKVEIDGNNHSQFRTKNNIDILSKKKQGNSNSKVPLKINMLDHVPEIFWMNGLVRHQGSNEENKDCVHITSTTSTTKVKVGQSSSTCTVADSTGQNDISRCKSAISKVQNISFRDRSKIRGHKDIAIKYLESLEKERNLQDMKKGDRYEKFYGLNDYKNKGGDVSQQQSRVNCQDERWLIGPIQHSGRTKSIDDSIKRIHVETRLNRENHEMNSLQMRVVNSSLPHARLMKISKIPIPIDKKRQNMNVRNNEKKGIRMKLDCRNSKKLNQNFIIFNPDNPSNSIIKMKESKESKESEPPESRTRVSKPISVILKIYWQDSMKIYQSLFFIVIIFNVYLTRNSIDLRCHYVKCSIRVTLFQKFEICFTGLIFISVNPKKKYSEFSDRWESIFFLMTKLKITFSYQFNDLLKLLFNIEEKCLNHQLQRREIDNLSLKSRGEIFNFERNSVDYYMENLFDFLSYMKGQKSIHTKKLNESELLREMKIILSKTVTIKKDSLGHMIFFCGNGKEERDNSSLARCSQNCWNNIAVYPVWKIKKSKYYDLPRNRIKHDTPEQLKQQTRDISEHNRISRSEINMQISEVSFNKISDVKLNKIEPSQKSAVTRKVSFKDDVNFSGDDSNVKWTEKTNSNHKDFHKDNIWEKNDTPNDLNLTDFLMTDSLMKITSSNSDNGLEKKIISDKSLARKLNFTESARRILKQLSESFEFRGKNEFQLKDEKLISRFYDETGRPLTEVFNQDGELIACLKNHNIDELMSLFYDSKNSEYFNEKGVRIERIFDSKGRMITRSRNEKQVKTFQADLQLVRYYDSKGNPIEHVYDSSGYELRTIGKDLTSTIFNDEGNLNGVLYNAKGGIIDAVYDSRGSIIAKISNTQIDPKNNQTISVNNVTDSEYLPKLFEKEKSIHYEKETIFNEDNNSQSTRQIFDANNNDNNSQSTRQIFDADGNPLTGVFDKKGKSLKIISSSDEAEKLLPYLFDKKGKLQKKRYDSKGRELKAVFDENGKSITGLSMQWLNELLKVNSKTEKKANSRNKSKCMPKLQVKQKLFDVDGKLITEVYDSKGSKLSTSRSGNAIKLLPFLFDENGKFMKNRFNRRKRKLMTVHDELGNIISSISATFMENLKKKNDQKEYVPEDENSRTVKKIDSEIITKNEIVNGIDMKVSNLNEKKSVNELKVSLDSAKKTEDVKENCIILNTHQDNGDKNTKTKGNAGGKSEHKIHRIEKNGEYNNSLDKKLSKEKAGESIHKFYDCHGNVITSIFDSGGNVLKKTVSGDIQELASYLFDQAGLFCKRIYNAEGKQIVHIYDQRGRSISRISIPSVERIEGSKNAKETKLPGSVYDERGSSVKEIYDEKGRPIIKTKMAKLRNLAPIIFDEKGLRRQIYDRHGQEIGPIYDYQENLIERLPGSLKAIYMNNKHSAILGETGKPITNYYDSEGSLIIALYNDYGEELCAVKEGDQNVQLLTKFFFDKYGRFSRGRFYNYRGSRIKHVYDIDGYIIRHIWRVHSRQPNRMNKVNNDNGSSRYEKEEYFGKNEIMSVETKDVKSNDTLPTQKLNSSEIRVSAICSLPQLASMKIKKFYDERGKLLTGIYDSKNRLLGYTASGNARTLAPYLFDKKGTFIQRRYQSDGKSLTNIFDSDGNPIKKISPEQMTKHNLRYSDKNNKKQRIYYDYLGNPIESIYDSHGNEIFVARETYRAEDLMKYLFDSKGNLFDDIYNVKGEKIRAVYDEHHKEIKSNLVSDSTINVLFQNESRNKKGDEDVSNRKSKNYISFLNNFKEKFLTVLFDNQNNQRDENILNNEKSPEVVKRIKNVSKSLVNCKRTKKKNFKKTKTLRKRRHNQYLYDEQGIIIESIFDQNGRRIDKVYDSVGSLICELYSSSGNLVKNCILKNMFEDDATFCPKACNSGGEVIDTIYANDRMITKVFDKNGKPAKENSEIIYLVSEQSLPKIASSERVKPVQKQMQYFPEVSGQPLNFIVHFERRTDNCQCEECQKMGRVETTVGNFGNEILDRLSRFKIPFLPQTLIRHEPECELEDNDSKDDRVHEELDSLEELINKSIRHRKNTSVHNFKEVNVKKKKTFRERDRRIPFSREMIENTLRKYSNLNDPEVGGEISNTIIQHFTTLILQEIKHRVYRKLTDMQWPEMKSTTDVCVGTELKFDDPLIGRHSSVQTSFHYLKREYTPYNEYYYR